MWLQHARKAVLREGATYKTIYAIESEIRDLDAAERLAIRQARTRPVFDEIVAWTKVYQPHEPASSMLGAALRYLTNHQLALARMMRQLQCTGGREPLIAHSKLSKIGSAQPKSAEGAPTTKALRQWSFCAIYPQRGAYGGSACAVRAFT